MTARQQRRLQQQAQRRAQKIERRRANQLAVEAAAGQRTAACLRLETPMERSEETPATYNVSERKLAANRANAQLSTGPTSAAGKQVVSQNSTRHGLTGNFQVLLNECQADFDKLLESLLREEAPADHAEIEFVRQMAEALWLSRRAVRLQNACTAALFSGDEREQRAARRDLALFMRYQVTHDRTFVRYSTEMRKRRNERRKVERGFESQKAREAQQQGRQAAENRRQELHELKLLREKEKIERRHLPKNVSKPAEGVSELPAVAAVA